ncbi:MAG: hypothetical protein FJX37_03695 [Alphaproteobacteria bacterium]|nr:hypothetical protein [Alphaproteobacteria bacterium]MBM3950439.1 hypothetical protein [Rhodospirillales bacterium]
MDQLIAWTILFFGILLPAAHVAFAPGGGGWKAEPGARCPFGPRLGWIIIVTLLPFAGWLMFVAARRRRRRTP